MDDDDDDATAMGKTSGTSTQPAWMRTLLDRSREWLEQLPKVIYLFFSTRHQLTLGFLVL
jgi:hypothetical protein